MIGFDVISYFLSSLFATPKLNSFRGNNRLPSKTVKLNFITLKARMQMGEKREATTWWPSHIATRSNLWRIQSLKIRRWTNFMHFRSHDRGILWNCELLILSFGWSDSCPFEANDKLVVYTIFTLFMRAPATRLSISPFQRHRECPPPFLSFYMKSFFVSLKSWNVRSGSSQPKTVSKSCLFWYLWWRKVLISDYKLSRNGLCTCCFVLSKLYYG